MICCFLAVFSLTLPGLANNWHAGSAANLVCSDCHLMHISGYTKLLSQDTINNLCTMTGCHDGGTGSSNTAPDVIGTAKIGRAHV